MERGLTEEKISQLDVDDGDFTARETMALRYAEMLATDHPSIDDFFFEKLHREFNGAEIVELGMMIGQYIGFGRMLASMDLPAT